MKELGKKAIANQLEKYFLNHYSNLPNLERRGTEDYHILKFATPEKIITLICDDFGNITEKVRKRKQQKEEYSQLELNLQEIPSPKRKEKFKEGETVYNIYSKKEFQILEIVDNIAKVKEPSMAVTYLMAVSDLTYNI